MKEKNKSLCDLNIQYFADGDEGNEGGSDNNNGDQNHDESGEKTFTQTEVSGMMAKEKNEGKRSVLKNLGFKSEQEAMEAIKKYNEFVESQQSEAEKSKAAADKAESEKNEALQRAKNAEDKLACYNSGVNAEYIDDVYAIASSKVTDDKDLQTVLKEMKEDEKYKSFFTVEKDSSSGFKGTGSNAGHGNNHSGEEKGYGAKLAKRNMPSSNKSSYFND